VPICQISAEAAGCQHKMARPAAIWQTVEILQQPATRNQQIRKVHGLSPTARRLRLWSMGRVDTPHDRCHAVFLNLRVADGRVEGAGRARSEWGLRRTRVCAVRRGGRYVFLSPFPSVSSQRRPALLPGRRQSPQSWVPPDPLHVCEARTLPLFSRLWRSPSALPHGIRWLFVSLIVSTGP